MRKLDNRNVPLIMGILPDDCFDGSLEDVAYRYIKRQELFTGLGVDLKFLIPVENEGGCRFFKLGTVLREKTKSILEIRCEDIPEDVLDDSSKNNGIVWYFRVLNWPRDIFQVFGDKFYTPSMNVGFTRSLISQMGYTNDVVVTDIGEGGLSVRSENIVIATQVPNNPLNWDPVREEGYEVQTIQLPMRSFLDPKKLGRERYNGHIDTELNIARTPCDNLLLLVNRDFYRVFKSDVNRVAKTLGAKKYVVDGNECEVRGLNFVNLPDKKIVVDSCCGGILKFLKKNISHNRVIPLETFSYECVNEGALRCRTNLVAP